MTSLKTYLVLLLLTRDFFLFLFPPQLTVPRLSKMTRKKNQPTPAGPPAALTSQIDHLKDSLRNLLSHLPLDPRNSNYHFSLDPDNVDERGTFDAFTHCMEICFETWRKKDHAIHFKERGQQMEQLTKLMKTAAKTMSDGECEVFHERWLE